MQTENGRNDPPASWPAIFVALLPVALGAPIAASGRFGSRWPRSRSLSSRVPPSPSRSGCMARRTPSIQPARPALILKAVLATPVVVIIMSAVGTMVARTMGWQANLDNFVNLRGHTLALTGWLAIVWTSAAFGEEMVFRGIVMRNFDGILRRSGASARIAPILGLLGSSLIFGLAHAYQGNAGIVMTAVAGLLYGTIYLLSPGNLWPSVLVHGVTDTVGFVALYLGMSPVPN